MLWTIICFLIAGVVVALDQITKVIAVDKLIELPKRTFEFIPGVLNFTYIENDGMALGMLDSKGGRIFYMTVSTIAIIGLIVYMIVRSPKSKSFSIAVGLIIGGGIGNMIDRLFFNSVLDPQNGGKVVRDFINFIGFGRLWIWVFNVADACVCIGGGLLFLWCIISLVKEYADDKKNKAVAAVSEKIVKSVEDSDASVETDGDMENAQKTEEQNDTTKDQENSNE